MKRSIDADLELVLADGRVMVESAILRLTSPVFKSMLAADMSESRAWKVHLPDKTLGDFQTLYDLLLPLSPFEITADTVEVVAVLAKEYCIDRLVKKCEAFMGCQIEYMEPCALGDRFAFAKHHGFKIVANKVLEHAIDYKLLSPLFLNRNAFDAMENSDLAFKSPGNQECFTLSQVLYGAIGFADEYVTMGLLRGFPITSDWFNNELYEPSSPDRFRFNGSLCRGPLRSKEWALRMLMHYLDFVAGDSTDSRRERYVERLVKIYYEWQDVHDTRYLRYRDADDRVDLITDIEEDTRPNQPEADE